MMGIGKRSEYFRSRPIACPHLLWRSHRRRFVEQGPKRRQSGRRLALNTPIAAFDPDRSAKLALQRVGLCSGVYLHPQARLVQVPCIPISKRLLLQTHAGAEPLITALLVGITAQDRSEQFFAGRRLANPARLETHSGGRRHNSDFQANAATLWNFSTFGCCAYSEKRSTPFFWLIRRLT